MNPHPRQAILLLTTLLVFVWLIGPSGSAARDAGLEDCIYDVGELLAKDSHTALKEGEPAPEFTLPSVSGETISLSEFRGKKNVVISFVPAAWTPVCSAQWPQYNDARSVFDEHDAVLLGVTVDNLPTLYAWTKQLTPDRSGFWFSVLSDFFPHGSVSQRYGVLRSNGTSERALFVIDKKGVIRYVEVMDINRLPHFARVERALAGLN